MVCIKALVRDKPIQLCRLRGGLLGPHPVHRAHAEEAHGASRLHLLPARASAGTS
ncbi:MAG: hypothetical protein MZV70_46920 [Desulfobacterales bacterium]|nr:hypothetical protein [Desulfobacterales bacterium]